MSKFRLDFIDYKIMHLLQLDARMSNIDLSSHVGVSPSPCLRRVRALEHHGYIQSYHAKLHAATLGYGATIFASIRIEVADDSQRNTFESALASTPEVIAIYALGTDTDYLCKIVAPDYQHYKIFVVQHLSKIPFVKQVKSTHIQRTIKDAWGIPLSLPTSSS